MALQAKLTCKTALEITYPLFLNGGTKLPKLTDSYNLSSCSNIYEFELFIAQTYVLVHAWTQIALRLGCYIYDYVRNEIFYK